MIKFFSLQPTGVSSAEETSFSNCLVRLLLSFLEGEMFSPNILKISEHKYYRLIVNYVGLRRHQYTTFLLFRVLVPNDSRGLASLSENESSFYSILNLNSSFNILLMS